MSRAPPPALLAASALLVPPSSLSCQGIIPGISRPAIGDLLAQPLAGLDSGDNRIDGGCERGACRVRVTHRGAEESVFSHEFRFRTSRGRLIPTSLECISTP